MAINPLVIINIGEYILEAITWALRTTAVHLVILFGDFAKSEWCLDELHLIIESRTSIVPKFWESKVRMDDKNGMYAEAFRKHKEVAKFNTPMLEKRKISLCRFHSCKLYQ
ncbi:hypothetical protein SUGI_0749690 [Cryptomeria japonica]|nr:hypothetical protein SUGI_0749690 [Cryptomeria japonica]